MKMRSMGKRIWISLLIAVLGLAMCLCGGAGAEEKYVVVGITWTLDGEGVLTVSGTGEMNWHPQDAQDWAPKVRRAIIQEGITAIKGTTFTGCVNLTEVQIPGSVKEIGGRAFRGCSGLKSIVLLEGVSSIGAFAFEECFSLQEVTMPDTIRKIPKRCFAECEKLEKIRIPAELTEIGSEAFVDCRSLTLLDIPDSVVKIGRSMMEGCSAKMTVICGAGSAMETYLKEHYKNPKIKIRR